VIVDKPWGKVVTYALNQPSSVRVITVEPGQETSVHYHQMRDEMCSTRGSPFKSVTVR
jgi:mannose-6-phosphate isomerase-like protein (cupin superfamily)